MNTAAAIDAPPASNAASHCRTVPQSTVFQSPGKYKSGRATNSHAANPTSATRAIFSSEFFGSYDENDEGEIG
jgi:hypothetical protein